MILNDFKWLQNNDGEWFWKAEPSVFLKKNPKKLKAKYHDLPWFPVSKKIEEETKKDFNKMLVLSVKQVVKQIQDG